MCLLLLEPVINSSSEKIEKPILVFAQDNSESILLGSDSIFYLNNYQDSINKLKSELALKYDVKTINFGSNAQKGDSLSFKDKYTNFDQLLTNIKGRYFGRNLASIVIASDGIFNVGAHPVYKEYGLGNVIIHALALGDTLVRKDNSIQKIRHNKKVKIGNKFPVELQLLSKSFKGASFNVQLIQNGQVIEEKSLSVDQNLQSFNIPFTINAEKEGVNKFEFKIDQLEGEITYKNNSSVFYIDVIKETLKVLVVASSPHPDIAVLKASLNNKIGRDLEIVLFSDLIGNVMDYDLLILHRLYNNNSNKLFKLIEKAKMANISILHISGNTLRQSYFNKMKTGIQLGKINGSYNVSCEINPGFNSFIIDSEMSKMFSDYPPLDVPFSSDYKSKSKSDVVINQKINGVLTNYPLIQFSSTNNQKQCTILGEGIWRWRFNEFLENGNSNVFDSFFSKVIQYLLTSNKKDRFIVDLDQEFKENDPIRIYSKLYNDNYELVNSANVQFELFKDSVKILEKNFNSNDNGYSLTLNQLEPGNYFYKASSELGKKSFIKKGSFIVKELKLEYMKTNADFQFLKQLSSKYSGSIFTTYEFDKLASNLLNKVDVVEIIHVDTKNEEIIKWKLLFLIISSFLFLEWFIRKLSGGY
ncbi:MAG: hypothetical protein P8M12_01580 [Flavobacteriales bacterium]|nr:hypothetical protein [Flavobacteriales bacterium]